MKRASLPFDLYVLVHCHFKTLFYSGEKGYYSDKARSFLVY